MTDLKSVSAPAISEAGVKRLIAFARPSRLKNDCTLFDAGYEQCKADLMLKINAEVIIPAVIERAPVLNSDELRRAQVYVTKAKAEADQAKRASRSMWPW